MNSWSHNPRPNPNAWRDALDRLRQRLEEAPKPAQITASVFFHNHPQNESCSEVCKQLN